MHRNAISENWLANRKVGGAPSEIGSLNAHDNRVETYVTVPAEGLSELVAVASSGKVKQVDMTGTKLKWRKGLVSHVAVTTDLEKESGEEK